AESLEESLQAIAEFRQPGNEPLKDNQVAWHWLKQTQSLILSKHDKKTAAQLAARRVFGDAPGAYGAGVNRLVERSGAWETRDEVAQAYIHRMGHIYSETNTGFASHEVFSSLLKNVENTYLGRASNLYGLLDNNDAFDYLGGLSLAVETVSGNTPNAHVIQHADVNNPKMDNLPSALISELRGRFLNPQWLTALMQHDYAGARTMGSEFLEYLWGWQVTNPEIIKSWMWDEVKNVYFDDKYNIGLDDFLEKNHNAHVKANMLAIFLVAAQKGFWKTDPNTLKELANQFTQLVLKNGLPGSGHTHAKHPMLQWIQEFISEELKASLQALIEKDQIEVDEPSTSISSLTQIDMIDQPKNRQAEEISAANPSTLWLQKLLIVLFAGLIILFGFYRGQQTNRSISHV
ncbi:MAG: cobaltochelatase subunit CobN, partial [Gammaproteobacteria bacterium]|nr:cobaltochelatase subunit CobN [Gammaproteobacteria bacterium]